MAMILYIDILNMLIMLAGRIPSSGAVRGDGGIAGKGKPAGEQIFLFLG